MAESSCNDLAKERTAVKKMCLYTEHTFVISIYRRDHS